MYNCTLLNNNDFNKEQRLPNDFVTFLNRFTFERKANNYSMVHVKFLIKYAKMPLQCFFS